MNPIWFPLVSADEEADFALDFFPGVVDHPHQRTSVKLAILPANTGEAFSPLGRNLQTPHPKTMTVDDFVSVEGLEPQLISTAFNKHAATGSRFNQLQTANFYKFQ
jgi:hypothetical protein